MIIAKCDCGATLEARDEFAGKRAECPVCGKTLQIPDKRSPSTPPIVVPIGVLPTPVTKSIDPPTVEAPAADAGPSVFRRMFEALLDPRSIQWMLLIGGGLSVLGVIIWLVSRGIFENPVVLAIAMGLGTLAILGSGWYLVLKTKYKVAGQALTFLGCVVAPLNLWFYHAQELVTLDQNLWVGGVVCCLVYAATVYALRDPLFMYAIEGGATLTVLLFLPLLKLVPDPTLLRWDLALFLMGLGLISIHLERAFSPEEGFLSRRRFGMPLFWCGHAQVGAALVVLLSTQLIEWVSGTGFGGVWAQTLLTDNRLVESSLLAGALWLAGTYIYLYSDIVVRRVGVYTYLAAFCLLLGIVSLIGPRLESAAVILVLAFTAVAANLGQSVLARRDDDKLARVMMPLGIILSALPLLFGVILHFRATSEMVAAGWKYDTDGLFVIAMLAVAIGSRASAYLQRQSRPSVPAIYLFFSAGAVIVAAAGLLRWLNVTEWSHQAPLLMLIPIGYIIASRAWRGRAPERPLAWIAHAATAVILVHVLGGAMEMVETTVRPLTQRTENLFLGLVFVEATVFHVLAGLFRKRSLNVYFAAAAACGALWQFMAYQGVAGAYYTILYCVLAMTFLVVGKFLGLEQTVAYRADGVQTPVMRGRGLAAFQSGNAVMSIALLAALMQGIARLATDATDWPGLVSLLLTMAASFVAVWIVPRSGWRRLYSTASIALAALVFLTLNVLIDLNGWQKLEIFCVVVGLGVLVSSHIGRFRETEEAKLDMVGFGLFLGSILAAWPLLVAVIFHHFVAKDSPTADDVALLAVTIVMVVSGSSWRLRSTALVGGGSLLVYLIMVIFSIAYQPQVAVGVYLAIGGALVFACGLVLSIYRDRLLALPERIAKREGLFRVLNWR